MMKRSFLLLLICVFFQTLDAQNGANAEDIAAELPYREIPAYPAEYTAETVAARMVDGLGFRYYWATEGLRPEDLAYQPSEGARSSEETIDHILGLTNFALNAVKQAPNGQGGAAAPATFDEKRAKTLENILTISDILKSGKGTLAEYPIIFQRGEERTELPFWNLINGPIADALWHVGQVVTFRRSSGNPINSKASMLMGTVRE